MSKAKTSLFLDCLFVCFSHITDGKKKLRLISFSNFRSLFKVLKFVARFNMRLFPHP